MFNCTKAAQIKYLGSSCVSVWQGELQYFPMVYTCYVMTILYSYLYNWVTDLLYLFLQHCLGSKKTYLFTFSVAVMTWWKTVLYMMQYLPFCGGGEYSSQNTLFQTIFVLWLPNSFWILVPFMVMRSMWGKILNQVHDKVQ